MGRPLIFCNGWPSCITSAPTSSCTGTIMNPSELLPHPLSRYHLPSLDHRAERIPLATPWNFPEGTFSNGTRSASGHVSTPSLNTGQMLNGVRLDPPIIRCCVACRVIWNDKGLPRNSDYEGNTAHGARTAWRTARMFLLTIFVPAGMWWLQGEDIYYRGWAHSYTPIFVQGDGIQVRLPLPGAGGRSQIFDATALAQTLMPRLSFQSWCPSTAIPRGNHTQMTVPPMGRGCKGTRTQSTKCRPYPLAVHTQHGQSASHGITRSPSSTTGPLKSPPCNSPRPRGARYTNRLRPGGHHLATFCTFAGARHMHA